MSSHAQQISVQPAASDPTPAPMTDNHQLNHGLPSNNKETNNGSPHSKDNGSLGLNAKDQGILNSTKKEQGGGLSWSGSQKHGCWNAWLCSTCSRYSMTAPWLLFWMCCAGAVQGMVINGFVNTSITTIEKRFNMKSRSTGMIAGFYDIACLVVSVPVSYMGSRPGASKPRWLGVGLIIMGVGSFVFTLPHFIAGPYDASAVAADGGDGGGDTNNNDTVLCSFSFVRPQTQPPRPQEQVHGHHTPNPQPPTLSRPGPAENLRIWRSSLHTQDTEDELKPQIQSASKTRRLKISTVDPSTNTELSAFRCTFNLSCFLQSLLYSLLTY